MKQTILLALTGLLGLVSCSVYDVRMGEVDGMYSMDKMAGAGPAGMPNGCQGRPGGKAGVLTAGEWNDLDHWDFWSGLMGSQDYGGMSAYWRMYTPRRVAVRVADAAGKRLPALRITLEQNQKVLWSTLTDNTPRRARTTWSSPSTESPRHRPRNSPPGTSSRKRPK